MFTSLQVEDNFNVYQFFLLLRGRTQVLQSKEYVYDIKITIKITMLGLMLLSFIKMSAELRM
jgi:hypothetical protein